MSRQLIESIVSGNMLEASDMLEAKLNEIRERKMYEMKRMYAAEAQSSEPYISPKTRAELAKGRRKASDVLGSHPYDVKPDKSTQLKSTQPKKASSNLEPESKFSDTKATALKKDPRLRTMDRLRKNLERYNTLKARGSTTADARLRKIAKGYAGKIAKQAVKNVAAGSVNAIKKAGDAPVFDDLKSIGMRNL